MRCRMALFAAIAFTSPALAQLNTINGSGSTNGINSGFGDVIGATSNLAISFTGTTLNFTLTRGPAALNDYAVIYIDSVAGGFANTTMFNDGNDPTRAAISARGSNAGNPTPGRADITFAPGFEADFAIGFSQFFGGLWGLAAGGNNSLPFVTSVNFSPLNNTTSPTYTFSMDVSQIGVVEGGDFDYVMTYMNPNDSGGNSIFRSNEFNGVAQATVPGGNIGANPFSLNNNDFNRYIYPVPEPTTVTAIAMSSLVLGGGVRRVWRRRAV